MTELVGVSFSGSAATRGSSFLAALEAERTAALRGAAFKVTSIRRVENLLVLGLEPQREAGKSTAIDESLEGCRAVWFDEPKGRGEVVVVNPELGEVTLRFVQGPSPVAGQKVMLFPEDFLTPLIDLWRDPELATRALKVPHRDGNDAIKEPKPLPPAFAGLRTRQAEAVQVALYRAGTIVGPPGTGKTYTVGALIANLLRRLPNARVILTGPTNVAVDTALLSADDWLVRIGREELRPSLKRIGSRFDSRKYAGRAHLLADGLYEASLAVSMLEMEEPPKADVARYVAWKEKLDAARAKLKADVSHIARTSRVIALTTASLFHYFREVQEGSSWHFVIADEASQIMLPAALMAASLGRNSTFAGDPNQLAPIVQSDDPEVEKLLGITAFESMTKARTVFLDEQSRMCVGICDVVSHTFYDGRLRVCAKARQDPEWKRERSPWFVNGREVPRVLVDDRAGEAKWSTKYNGLIRFRSAAIVEALVQELLGSYAAVDDLLVLTPFRAQRVLLRGMFRRDATRRLRVSTVHRSQGSESKIVIFDPVSAGASFLNSENGRRLINVAASRAQAHLVLTVGSEDLLNPWLAALCERARLLWDRPGAFAGPMRVSIPQR